MEKTKLINTNILTEKSNKKELDFRNKQELQDKRTNSFEKWQKKILNGRLNIIPQLKEKNVRFYGNILELGAGMCWLSSELSKIKEVKKVFALDFSEILLTKIAPKVINYLNADKSKITRVIGDFYKLDFEPKSFDFVVFDAAVHHVNPKYLKNLLNEIDKVLKDNGKIIAIREPVLPLLRKKQRNKFGIEDKKQGATELIFTKEEWKKLFRKVDYNLKFIPYAPTNKFLHKLILYPPFRFLNNLIFGNYVFVISK